MRFIPITPISLAFCFATAVQAMASDLTVVVTDVHSDKGTVNVAVYDSEASYMQLPLAKAKARKPATPGEVVFIFHDLPAGRYAVTSYHDENGNDKLDKNVLGIPSEGYGFSNDAQGTAGPAKYRQAAFTVDGTTAKTVRFSLNY